MRNHRRYVLLAPASCLVVTFAAPTVEAGGGVSMHLGGGGFGVSVGFGDWGVYTNSWSDPYWSIDFNATLAGYGEWMWVNGLGRVWRPWVATSWRPYTHGQWVSTGCGMTWVAYEPWGYVPHHYGSWAYASFGWVWVPGYTYSCANVVWVGSGGYIGWYARPPWGWSHAQHGFRHGYSHGYRDGFRDGYDNGYIDWLARRQVCDLCRLETFRCRKRVPPRVTHRIASQTRIEGRAGAPSRDEIRQRGGAAITETRLSRRTMTVDGREITIARPDGVARNIERNAAETVAGSLSEQALQQRQPLVRPRSSSATATASSPRSADVFRETGSPQVRDSTREPALSRNQQSGISGRSSHDQPSMTRSSGIRTSSRSSGSSSAARREPNGAPQAKPLIVDVSRTAGSRLSRSAPSESARSRTATEGRQSTQRSQQTSGPQPSQVRERQPVTTGRHPAPTEQRASESRRSPSPNERSATERSKRDSEKKSSEEPSRKRRR